MPGRSDQVDLRAERSSIGDGRVYRVAFTVSDGRGGSCNGVATVGVAKGLGTGPAIDSAGSFNSLASA